MTVGVGHCTKQLSSLMPFSLGLAVIQDETIRNIIIAGIAVAIITLILLANVVASALVLGMLVLVDINVLGFMVRCGRVL